jgi:hypothetical protein
VNLEPAASVTATAEATAAAVVQPYMPTSAGDTKFLTPSLAGSRS